MDSRSTTVGRQAATDLGDLEFTKSFKFAKINAPIRTNTSPPKTGRASYSGGKGPPQDDYTKKLRRHLDGINKRLEVYDARLPHSRPGTTGFLQPTQSTVSRGGEGFGEMRPYPPPGGGGGYTTAPHPPLEGGLSRGGTYTSRTSIRSTTAGAGARGLQTAGTYATSRGLQSAGGIQGTEFMREVRFRAKLWLRERESEQREQLRERSERMLSAELELQKRNYPFKVRRSTHKALTRLAQRNIGRRIELELEKRKMDNGWTQGDGRASSRVLSKVGGEYKRQLRQEYESHGGGWDGPDILDVSTGHYVQYTDEGGPVGGRRSSRRNLMDRTRSSGERTAYNYGEGGDDGGAFPGTEEGEGGDEGGGALSDGDEGGAADEGGVSPAYGGAASQHQRQFPPSPPPQVPGTKPRQTADDQHFREASIDVVHRLRNGDELPSSLSTLTDLRLEGLGLGTTLVNELVNVLGSFPALTLLDVSSNDIGAAAAATLLDGLYTYNKIPLKHLDLSSNAIGGGGSGGGAAVSAFLDAERKKGRKRLKILSLRANRLGNSGARTVAQSMKKNTSVTWLDLAENAIGKAGVRALGDMLGSNTTLEVLDISWNDIGEEGFSHFTEKLAVNTGLKALDMSWNVMGVGGGTAMAMCIRQNCCLESLNLSSCRLDDEAVLALAAALPDNGSLIALNVDNNPVGVNAGKQLMKAVYMGGRLVGFGRHGTNTENLVSVHKPGNHHEQSAAVAELPRRRLPSLLALPDQYPALVEGRRPSGGKAIMRRKSSFISPAMVTTGVPGSFGGGGSGVRVKRTVGLQMEGR